MGLFGFLQPVEHALGSAAHNTMSFLGNVATSKPAQAINKFADSNANPVTLVKNELVQPTLSFLGNVGKSSADIVKGGAASVTHNPVALANANKAKAKDEAAALQPIARPLVQAAETIVHPTTPHTYTPQNTPDQNILLGKEPIQNIPAGIQSNYREHPNLNPAERLSLASLYGGGQAVQDVLTAEGIKGGIKGAAEDTAKGVKTVADNRTPLNEVGAVGKDVNVGSNAHASDEYVKRILGESQAFREAEAAKPPQTAETQAAGQKQVNDIFNQPNTPEERTPAAPLTPDDLHKLSQATSVKEVETTLKGKIAPDVIDKVAPAIAQTKDPGIIDNIVTRAATPEIPAAEPAVPVPEPTPEAVQPQHEPLISQHLRPEPTGNAATGERSLQNLARSSTDFNDFANKFHKLPENNHVRAAIAEMQPADLKDLYDTVNVKKAQSPAAQQVIDALQGRAASPGVAAVKGARSIRAAQEASYKVERGQRIEQAGANAQNLSGTEAYKAKLAALKGDLSKQEYTGLKGQLSPDRAEQLYSNLHESVEHLPIDDYTKLNTQTALRKVIFGEGGVPTNSEIKLLQNAFGDGFAETIKEDVARHRTVLTTLQKAGEVVGVPRAIMASADLSGGLRQGLAAATRHPLVYAKNFVKQFKDFKSEDAFQEGQQEIYNHPNYDLARESGLAINDLGQGVNHREEQFASSLAERIPGIGRIIRGSDRAFTGLLNNMRFNIFNQLVTNAENAGIDLRAPENIKVREDLARVVNTSTGRGDFGKFFQKHADTLSTVFFSPRLMASRIQTLNPAYYIKLDPLARREALTTLASLGAFAGTILGAASLAGAKVVTDPRNSDFGKIKVGDTRFDILGGYQQYLKLGAQLASGKIISSTTGHEETIGSGFGSPTRLDVVEQFLQGKENPALSFVTDLLKGKNANGTSVYNPKGISGEVASRFVPLILQDLNDLRTHPSSAGLAAIIPGALGVGLQTYGVQDIGISPKDQGQIDELQKNGASAEELNANQLFYQTLKNAPDRTKISGEINQALANGDLDTAQKLADNYNQQYAAHFKQWADKYGKYSNANLIAAYNKNKLTLSPASIQSRQRSIKSNPSLYQATTGG